jgi:predicted nucleic-acid-binding protein
MVGVDTNVIVRFLIKDDPEHYRSALSILQHAKAENENVYISLIVLAEVSWVLKSVYKFSRRELHSALQDIISNPLFVLQEESAVEDALRWFSSGKADFADYLAGVMCKKASGSPLLTFDKNCSEKQLFADASRRGD